MSGKDFSIFIDIIFLGPVDSFVHANKHNQSLIKGDFLAIGIVLRFSQAVKGRCSPIIVKTDAY